MGDQSVNLLLVEEIKKRPVLYNPGHEGYTNRNQNEKAWTEVSKIVNMTVLKCKERWKNLRAVFVRNLKPTEREKRKRYYLMEAMQFAIPFIKSLTTTAPGHIPILPQQYGDEFAHWDDLDDESNISGMDTLSEPNSPSLGPTQLPVRPSASTRPLYQILTPDHTMAENDTSSPHSSNSKLKRSVEDDGEEKSFIDYPQRKKAKTFSSLEPMVQNPEAEAMKMFLLSMLPDLMKMTDEEVRRFKRETLHCIDHIFVSRSVIRPEGAAVVKQESIDMVDDQNLSEYTS